MKDAYSTKELVEKLDITKMTVTRRAKRENWDSRPNKGKGGGKEWLSESMPEETRAQIALAETKDLTKIETASSIKQSADLPCDDVTIPDWAFRIGMARYRIVMAFRKACAKKGEKKSILQESFIIAYNSGNLLEKEYKLIGETSVKTVYRWNGKLKKNKDDYRCLCDGRGKWKSGEEKKQGRLSVELESIVLNCYLQANQPTIALAFRATEAIAATKNIAVPSIATVRRFINRFSKNHADIVTLKREGEKALKDNIGPYITRDANLLSVGDVLFCDGHVLNFEVTHPFTGRQFRPTLIMWFDWRSRMPVGWTVAVNEDTQAIAVSLHSAIKNLGQCPRTVYIDNGRAFKSKFFTGDADFQEMEGLYARLGINVQFSKPYEARTKIVERFFRTFSEQFARLIPSYCGQNIMDKPAWRARNEKYHQAHHDAVTNGYKLTMHDCSEIIASYIHWYGNQPHTGIEGRKPLDLLQAGLGEGVNMLELDRHFLFRHEFSPSRCRVVIGKVVFQGDCLYGFGKGKKLIAMYNWMDMREIYIHDMQGKRIGSAYPVEALNPLAKHFGDELDMIKIKEANKLQARLKRDTMRIAKTMDEAGMETAGFGILPFVPKAQDSISAPLKREIAAPELEETISPEESAIRADRIAKRIAKEDAKDAEQNDRPDWFNDQLERYEWCFMKVYKKHQKVSQEDQDFMVKYESSDEYERIAKRRFEDLRSLYADQLLAAQA